jgi:5-methylcytosine-specific restriction endonuclease McrA
MRRKLFVLLERDGYECCWCGKVCNLNTRPCNDSHPTVEHVIRRADGGTNKFDNLRVACRRCNNGRHNRKWNRKLREVTWVSPKGRKSELPIERKPKYRKGQKITLGDVVVFPTGML